MKTKYFLCFIAIPILLHLDSCYRVYSDVIVDCSKLYRTNVVGIAGEPSATPYVEIIYSVDDGKGKNITQSMMVSPPYIFESQRVNIKYDSIVRSDKKGVFGYILVLKRSYEEGGADYFRIVNHSADKPIEFFLVGAQDVKEADSGWGSATILPWVYYRHAPIYYLLYPDKKYHKNLMWENIVFHFEGNRCGDLELTSAWSVEDVMQLYRAEYRHSADTLLYVDGGGESNGKRMAIHPAYAANSSTGTTDRRLAPRFYGAILPGEQLTGDENFWLPATPIMFHETLQWEVH